MPTIRGLKYPVLVVNAKKKGRWFRFKIVGGRARYFTFTRLPLVKQYDTGTIFDGSGQICRYDGMTAWPELDDKGWPKAILENLMVFPILFRICALFFNIGPRIVESRKVDLAEFKAAVLDALRLHNSKAHIENLSALLERGYGTLPPADAPADVIRWVDGWIADRSLKMANPDDIDEDHPGYRSH